MLRASLPETFHYCPPPGPVLPLSADLVPQDEVSNEPQTEEEDGKDDEIQVEFGIQHVQLFQDGLRLLEVTCMVFITMKILSIQTIDRQDDTLKTISATQRRRRKYFYNGINCKLEPRHSRLTCQLKDGLHVIWSKTRKCF